MTINIIREKRRSATYRFLPNGIIEVKAPLRMPKEYILSFFSSREKWVEQQFKKAAKDKEKIERQAAEAETQIKELLAGYGLPSEKLQLTAELFQKLAAAALDYFSERTAYYADMIGVTYGRISIRVQQTRWGSCSSKGNLNYNCLLMLAPPEVRDSVIVHELCHRIHMNHSDAFWNEVYRCMPDYAQHRKWLNEHQKTLYLQYEKAGSPSIFAHRG